MRQSIRLLGAVMIVLFGVGCGPPDQDELLGQTQESIATPILMGAGCPATNTCGREYRSCTEWSAPASCNTSPMSPAFQVQMCSDAQGNQCLNVALSAGAVR